MIDMLSVFFTSEQGALTFLLLVVSGAMLASRGSVRLARWIANRDIQHILDRNVGYSMETPVQAAYDCGRADEAKAFEEAMAHLEETGQPTDYRTAVHARRQECASCGRSCPHCARAQKKGSKKLT